MKYINNPNLKDYEIINFISSIFNYENSLYNNKKTEFKDISKYLKITTRNDKEVVIWSNFNLGLTSYNIVTIDDYNVNFLYPLFNKDYSLAWRKFLNDKFPNYKNDLKNYINNKDNQSVK